MLFKNKVVACVSVAILIIFIATGTYAWTSLDSQRVNEWQGTGANPSSGPGGTLHNDFEGSDTIKNVYIENWGSEDLFVRIRLDEYMEMGPGAGFKSAATDPMTGKIIPNPANLATSLISGASIDDLSTWVRHIPNASVLEECDTEADFHSYWGWTMGGQKYYYPAPESSREIGGYVDVSSPEGLTENSKNSKGVQAKQTLPSQVLTMADWLADGSNIGNYWVYDTDGWAYWAAPLNPGQATGLLLNTVNKRGFSETNYFYGVNVIAQMATKDGSTVNGESDNYESFGLEANSGWTQAGRELMDYITGNGSQPAASNTAESGEPAVANTPTATPVVSSEPNNETPTAAPTATAVPTAAAAPTATTAPTVTATPTPALDYTPPTVKVSKATVIDDVIYAKAGQVFELSVDSSSDFPAMLLTTNGALISPGMEDTAYYKVTAPLGGNLLKNSFEFKSEMPPGIGIPIIVIVIHQDQTTYHVDDTRHAVVIPEDADDVIKGDDGDVYLVYPDGKEVEFEPELLDLDMIEDIDF